LRCSPVARTAFEKRVSAILRGWLVSDKYVKVYKDSSHLMSGFTVMLFLVQVHFPRIFYPAGTCAIIIMLQKPIGYFIHPHIQRYSGFLSCAKFLIDKIIAYCIQHGRVH
jgi:hypothetical protein